MYAKTKLYLNITCYAYAVFLLIRDHHDLTFNKDMTFFFDLHGGDLKYAHEREAEDSNERKHISKNKKSDVHESK